jgi:hypothetical protein
LSWDDGDIDPEILPLTRDDRLSADGSADIGLRRRMNRP